MLNMVLAIIMDVYAEVECKKRKLRATARFGENRARRCRCFSTVGACRYLFGFRLSDLSGTYLFKRAYYYKNWVPDRELQGA